jgi:hypothetical protein
MTGMMTMIDSLKIVSERVVTASDDGRGEGQGKLSEMAIRFRRQSKPYDD